MSLPGRLLCILAGGHDYHLTIGDNELYYRCVRHGCSARTAGWKAGSLTLPAIQPPLITKTKRKRQRKAKVEPLRRKA